MKSNTVLPVFILRRMSDNDRKSLGKAGVLPEEAQAVQEAKNERELQGQIASYLRRNNIWFDQDATHKRRTGTAGTPDFIFCINGQAVAFEVKFKDGKLSQDQIDAHAKMTANGWKVFLIFTYKQAVETLTGLAIK